MTEPKLLMTAGALPYGDGSGDQFTATVERNDCGMMLRLNLVHEMKTTDWPKVRDAVDELVYSADRMSKKQICNP